MNSQKEIKNTDLLIEKLIENKETFQITMIAIIKMMHDSGDCDEYLPFYTKIGNALLDGEEVSTEEKLHFLAMHKTLVDVYNRLFPSKL